MVLGVSEEVSGLPDSEEEKKMSAVFMKAWATFAGDPKDGLRIELGWPKVGTQGGDMVTLGAGNQGKLVVVEARDVDAVCANFTVQG